MFKRFLLQGLALILFNTSFFANSAISNIVFIADFNDCEAIVTSGWSIYSVASNKDWSCTADGRGASGQSGDAALEINGYGADVASEDWLITPALSFEEGKNYILNFNSMLKYSGPALQVLYSTNYTGEEDPNNAEWTLHEEATAAVASGNSYDYINSGNISLKGITGDVYIAFKYTSTGTGAGTGGFYRIDDVVIKSNVLIHENFNNYCENGDFAVQGWSVQSIGTDGLITCSSDGFEKPTGDYSLKANGYSVGAGQAWVISPLLALGVDDFVITFASKVQYDGPMPIMVFSTDYDGISDPTTFNWTEITEGSNAISPSFAKSEEIDLSFINKDAYIGFKYVSEGASSGQSRMFLLDEFHISTPEPINDGGSVNITMIQGEGDESPYINSKVTVQGIVTAVFNGVEPYEGAGYTGTVNGFYMQDVDGDGNEKTSDAIYVYTTQEVSKGDMVEVSATVTEYFNLTELKDVSHLKVLSSDNDIPTPVTIKLPLASKEEFEQYESMLVTFTDELTVTENRNVGKYGELRLSANGILYQPTQQVDPNDANRDGNTTSGSSNVDAVNAYRKNIGGNNFVLDDARTGSNLSPIPYINANNTVPAGSTVEGLTGILTYGFNEYRVYPVEKPEFSYATRESVPSVGDATLKVVTFNVLNYFNGDGRGGGFPTSRGAKTLDDFEKQAQKIVSALTAINGDVIGLMEIENDDDNGYSAIEHLTNAINSELGANAYDYISTGRIKSADGSADEIKVGLLYNKTTVDAIGEYAILDNNFSVNFNDIKNRPALAQTFKEKVTGETFTVVVNHFKSKGSDCDAIGDPDNNDGQGNCSATRTLAAETLAEWLAHDPTNCLDDDYLVIGDLNSYAQEDPIDMFQSKGFVNLLNEEDYSYFFDGQAGNLDYGIANESMLAQVIDTKVWHINSIEPSMLGYDQAGDMYVADPYRSSDHDPVIIGLKLNNGDGLPVSVENVKQSNDIQVYPIPLENKLNVKINSGENKSVEIMVVNTLGEQVIRTSLTLSVGSNVISESFHEFGRGVYILKIPELDFTTKVVKH